MSMQTYHDLKDMLCEELEKLTRKGDLNVNTLDTVDKLTHSIKSLETIIAMNEAKDGGDSGYYPYWMRSYEGRGRSHAHRDKMGRYSREDAKAEMVDDLRDLMEHAKDDAMRRRLHRFITEIESE